MADQRSYDQGLRPKIFINWQTFVDRGIPNEWQEAFQNLVINAYTRWMNMAGIHLRFQFWNYTNSIAPNDGELIIYMDDRFGGGPSARIASTFGSYNRQVIIFHRQSSDTLTNWNFVPHYANDGEIDMYTILLHELGHCLGLDHSSNATDTLFGWTDFFHRFGLYRNDVERLQQIYNIFTENRLRQLVSTNGGSSWLPVNSNLTDINNNDARTNNTIGVTAVPNSNDYLVGYDNVNRMPSRAKGNGSNFLNLWEVFGGERSIFGPAFTQDDLGNILYAWVDNNDSGNIKIIRSTNGGHGWFWTAVPIGATTYGTPGLCFTTVNGVPTLVLVWSYFNRNNRNETGYIKSSVSTDFGATWSEPVLLDSFYKVLSGVSIAADNNNIVVGFSWAPNSRDYIGRTNFIRTFKCRVEGNRLVKRSVVISEHSTRIQPALAFDRGYNRFVMVYRAQNFNTSLNVVSMTFNANVWSNFVGLESRSNVAPCITYSNNRRELVIWYAFE